MISKVFGKAEVILMMLKSNKSKSPVGGQPLSSAVWKKMGRSFGWLALVFIVLSIISGFAWDLRTSGLMSTLTGGFVNRMVAIDLHTYALVPLVLTLVIHIALGARSHLTPNGRNKANDR
jgi:hypothetical protein